MRCAELRRREPVPRRFLDLDDHPPSHSQIPVILNPFLRTPSKYLPRPTNVTSAPCRCINPPITLPREPVPKIRYLGLE